MAKELGTGPAKRRKYGAGWDKMARVNAKRTQKARWHGCALRGALATTERNTKMNTLMNMDPWSIFEDMLGGSAFRHMRARAAGRFPPVNVFLDDNAVLIDLELPGKTAKDVDLTLEPQAVVIADKPAPVTDGESGAVAEPARPAWSRRIELPFRVNAEKSNAKFKDGILRVELPKAETEGVRKIAIAG